MFLLTSALKMKISIFCTVFILGVGTSLFIVGLSLALYGQEAFDRLFRENFHLGANTSTFKLWSHTPVPLYLEVYLFNWTNADEFAQDKSVLPKFEEVGPFVFKEVHDRVNVIWNENATVTYNQTRKWNFMPELSEDPDVKITNLNVIGTTLSQILKPYSKVKWLINWLFRKEHFFNTAPAKNWLFEGIDDKLMDYLAVIENMFHIPIPMKKFGWFYGRNMSSIYDGVFTVKTGINDIFEMGKMDKWNGVNKTDYFKDECAMVNGSSTELFPPMNTVQRDLVVFISDICSSLILKYKRAVYEDGLQSYRYVGAKTTFDNGQIYSQTKCYCGDKCAPYGVRDVSACKKAPLFFSFPHFYLADETYVNSVSGMMPNESEHEFMIEIDPVTGMPVNVRAQLQVNVHLEPIPWLGMYSDVPEKYIPMMWFREKAKITPDLVSEAIYLRTLPRVIQITSYVILAFSVLIVTVRFCILWRNYLAEDDDAELLIPPMMYQDEEDPYEHTK